DGFASQHGAVSSSAAAGSAPRSPPLRKARASSSGDHISTPTGTRPGLDLKSVGYDPTSGEDTVVRAAAEASSRSELVISVPIPHKVYELLPSSLTSRPVQVVPVMFTQGINEQQTLANAGWGAASVQRVVNIDGYCRLKSFAKQHAAMALGSTTQKLWQDLRTLWYEVQREVRRPGKHVGVLTVAADITRMLHGARITCCKSGKDRTAMSVTYEQARILHQRHGLPRNLLLPSANLMRQHGVRLPIAHKNVGSPLYAFNSLQVRMLPSEYKPPPETIASVGGTSVAT
ncbi:INPP4A, partial [Symbiodinium sp. KB8]